MRTFNHSGFRYFAVVYVSSTFQALFDHRPNLFWRCWSHVVLHQNTLQQRKCSFERSFWTAKWETISGQQNYCLLHHCWETYRKLVI